MKKKHGSFALILSAILIASSLSGCNKQTVEELVEDVAVVEVQNPVVGDLKLSSDFIATISPDESVYVIPKATAEVVEVLVDAGDIVEEGDVLAVLDDTMAQFSVKSAQISLDNAKHAYNLSYGEGASTLNNMQSDDTIKQAGDGVEALQENLVDAMDSLEKSKEQLKDAEKELADLKEEYDFNEDVDEIKDYADSIDKGTMEGLADYQAAMQRYQAAATAVAPVEAKIVQYKSAIDQCEASIDTIQKNIDSTYNKYSQAVTSTNISNGELREEQKEVSKNNISQAQLGMDQAKESLDTYTIKASISGVIESVNIKEHDFATSSNPAFVISNKDVMTATYYVSEDIRNTFSVGQKVTAEKDGIMYDGEVIEIGNAIDQNTGLFKIKAAIKGDTTGLLSGTKATIKTDTYHANNAIIIPYNSVYYEGTQAYVYTVVDGKTKKVNITTGLYDIDNIVVTEGLSKSDVVITTWSAQLREGVDISVIDKNAEK